MRKARGCTTINHPGRMVNRGGNGADDKHIRVLRQEKDGESHPTILDMKPGHEFRLRLRDIEGEPVGLRHGTGEVDEKSQGLHHD